MPKGHTTPRRRPRVSVSVARATLDRLAQRSRESGESIGREIDFAVREAEADHSRLCHAVGNAFGTVPFDCVKIREATRHPEVLAAVARIEVAVAAVRAVIARPTAGNG